MDGPVDDAPERGGFPAGLLTAQPGTLAIPAPGRKAYGGTGAARSRVRQGGCGDARAGFPGA
ncbi:hypothetical protein ACOTD8_26935, partial [Achromobacter dolens]|uniref:hypothetical protein n=1 Tax=Achromobacter dolens TaxID=1287738 RepID=UPI003B9C4AD9